MPQHEPLLNIREAASSCGILKSWLKRHIAAGHVPAIVIGRRLVFDHNQLWAPLAEMAAKSGAASEAKGADRAS